MGTPRPKKGAKSKKQAEQPAVTPESVEKLRAWVTNGGSGARLEPEIELRYSVDMFGLAKVLTDLADLVEGCRLLSQLEPSPREEGAIKKLKYHAGRHAQTLRQGKKPSEGHMRMTIENAQKLHDGLRADWDRFFAAAEDRFDRIVGEIREMASHLLEGEAAGKIAWLRKEFRAVYESDEAKPASMARAYKAARKFLQAIDGTAHAVARSQKRREEERSARRETSEDILAAIERL